MYPNRGYINQYRQTRLADAGEDNPHRVIALLLAGAIERTHMAQAGIDQGDIPAKVKAIGSAMSIVDALRASLDHDAGGDIARGLASLYEYISQRLVQANASNDVAALKEVGGLLEEIQSAWAAIPSHQPAAAGVDAGADRVG